MLLIFHDLSVMILRYYERILLVPCIIIIIINELLAITYIMPLHIIFYAWLH